MATFLAPFMGYYIYLEENKSFRLSMDAISLMFLGGIVLFLIVFYGFFHPLEMKKRGDSEDSEDSEEMEPVMGDDRENTPKQKGLIEVFYYCMKRKYLRNFMLFAQMLTKLFCPK